MTRSVVAESILTKFWTSTPRGGRSNIFGTTSKLVDGFRRGGCEIWPLEMFNVRHIDLPLHNTPSVDKHANTISCVGRRIAWLCRCPPVVASFYRYHKALYATAAAAAAAKHTAMGDGGPASAPLRSASTELNSRSQTSVSTCVDKYQLSRRIRAVDRACDSVINYRSTVNSIAKLIDQRRSSYLRSERPLFLRQVDNCLLTPPPSSFYEICLGSTPTLPAFWHKP